MQTEPQPDNAPEPVLLIIADISGYTRYMTANIKTLTHSQTIITELIKSIIKQIELPMEIAKLEGDAVFLFCRKQHPAHPWPQVKQFIGSNLITFFQMFSEKVQELTRSNICICNACTHIEKLRLKVVVHSGEALFHQVFNFVELAGVDVIIVHRLLKNSVNADQYLLLTEAAHRDVEFPEPIHLNSGNETYEDIGRIKTLVYLPEGQPAPVAAPAETPFATRFHKSWKLFCKMWFAPFAPLADKYHHLDSNSGPGKRKAFAWLTALLTPFFLPIGALIALVHAWREPALPAPQHDGHDHKPDGTCCRG